jgi:hypothetical protein
MGKKLAIWLPDTWANVENPDGPLTVRSGDSAATGYLQVSVAEYRGGEEPRPSEADLIELARTFGLRNQFGNLVSSSSGRCVLGLYGTAAFRPSTSTGGAPPYSQVWFLSNGQDIVFVTFFADKDPQQNELSEPNESSRALA